MPAKRELSTPIRQEHNFKRQKIEKDVGDPKLRQSTPLVRPYFSGNRETRGDVKPYFNAKDNSPHLSYQQRKRSRQGPLTIRVYLGGETSCIAHYDRKNCRVLLDVGITSRQASQVVSRLCMVGFRLERKSYWNVYYFGNSKIRDMNWAFDINECSPRHNHSPEEKPGKPAPLNIKPEPNRNSTPAPTYNRPTPAASTVTLAGSVMADNKPQLRVPVKTEGVKFEETIDGIPVVDLTHVD
ncbi:hypothetical protein F5X99DRAFT_424736 [Biscogniauxia marginata]|nr:hypothetical protein F5X99DRAFT_424736 [Biscogniauxia marginata]